MQKRRTFHFLFTIIISIFIFTSACSDDTLVTITPDEANTTETQNETETASAAEIPIETPKEQPFTIAKAMSFGLDDYPSFYNGVYTGSFVVTAGSMNELLTIEAFKTKLAADRVTVTGTTIFDRDLTNLKQNMVVVGDLCKNTALQTLFNTTACLSKYEELGVQDHQVYIGLFESSMQHSYLVVMGKNETARSYALNVVATHTHENFTGDHMVFTYAPSTAIIELKNATTYGLEDYPAMFDTGDGKFEGYFVVGANAPSNDVIALTQISMGMQAEGLELKDNQVKLDKEVKTYEENMIVLGDICENIVIQALLGYSSVDCADAYDDLEITDNEVYIGLFQAENEDDQNLYYLLILGEDKELRQDAAVVVKEHDDSQFEGQSMVYRK